MTASKPTGYRLVCVGGLVIWEEAGIEFSFRDDNNLFWKPIQEQSWLPMDLEDVDEFNWAWPLLLAEVCFLLESS